MWKCISENCRIIDGSWNGEGIAFYSISSLVADFREFLLEYMIVLAPVLFLLLFMSLLIFFIIHVFRTIGRLMTNSD